MKYIHLEKVKKEDRQSLIKTREFLDELIDLCTMEHEESKVKSMFGVSPDLPEFEREEEDFRHH